MPKNLTYKLEYSNQVNNFFKNIKKDNKASEIILKLIEEVVEDPFDSDFMQPPFKGARKKRKGKYRVIFDVILESNPQTIRLLKIDKRGKVYK